MSIVLAYRMRYYFTFCVLMDQFRSLYPYSDQEVACETYLRKSDITLSIKPSTEWFQT